MGLPDDRDSNGQRLRPDLWPQEEKIKKYVEVSAPLLPKLRRFDFILLQIYVQRPFNSFVYQCNAQENINY